MFCFIKNTNKMITFMANKNFILRYMYVYKTENKKNTQKIQFNKRKFYNRKKIAHIKIHVSRFQIFIK